MFDDIKPAHRHGTAGGRNESGDHPHGGGFARAVGAEKTQDFAPLHRERNPIHRRFVSELFRQVLNFNHVNRWLFNLGVRRK